MYKFIVAMILSISFLSVFAKFNRPDPKRDWDWLRPHTLNLYQYVKNDPINSWDPTGFTEKEVEAILKAIDTTLNTMAQESANDSGHERYTYIYKDKDGKINTNGIYKASELKGGTAKTVKRGEGKRIGGAHTHNEELNKVKNSPHSGVDIAAIAGRSEGIVNVVQSDTQRFAGEVNDPAKGKAFVKTYGKKEQVKKRYNKIMADYQKTDAGRAATPQQVQMYATLQIASEAGVTIYQTIPGSDQTDVVEVSIRKTQPEKEDAK